MANKDQSKCCCTAVEQVKKKTRTKRKRINNRKSRAKQKKIYNLKCEEYTHRICA